MQVTVTHVTESPDFELVFGGNGRNEGHYFYGHYYACQAMFLAGGDYWAQWYPGIRDQLIARQNRTTGGWSGDVDLGARAALCPPLSTAF